MDETTCERKYFQQHFDTSFQIEFVMRIPVTIKIIYPERSVPNVNPQAKEWNIKIHFYQFLVFRYEFLLHWHSSYFIVDIYFEGVTFMHGLWLWFEKRLELRRHWTIGANFNDCQRATNQLSWLKKIQKYNLVLKRSVNISNPYS